MSISLHKDLELLLDFYRQQRKQPPVDYAYAPGLLDAPSFFSLRQLQEHLQNPLLSPVWVHLVSGGKSVPLEQACMFKEVQGNQLGFMDKTLLNEALKNGAALVLEGVDILDAGINAFVGQLEEALPCSLCNCVAFFSQSSNEAYEGHCDSDDVLVVQLTGEKLWHIFAPQQRRFADTTHLTPEQMGPKIKELTMRPGDALYVRAGVPHVCNTTGDHSLHLAFDLIDSTPNVTQISQEANRLYDYACEDSYAAPEKIIDRYVELMKSEDFQSFIQSATISLKQDARVFRQHIGRSSAVDALSRFIE